MKNILKYTAIILAFAIVLVSCNREENPSLEGNGNMELYFDNGVNGDKLILGSSYKNSNGENLTINRLNYIISNIVLYKADGTSYIYPKTKSYFIISEEANLKNIVLENIPAGDYTKVKFGLGVDRQRYLEGETAQQEFWNYASEHHMVWTWSTGYRFINFEGTFNAENQPDANFKIHQGSNSSTDNYREITLNFPNSARVRQGQKPSVHIVADANVIADGVHKIMLKNNLNPAGTTASIMGGENLIKIAENTLKMFKIDHIHNGSGNHH